MKFSFYELKILFLSFSTKTKIGFILLVMFLVMLSGLEIIGFIAITPVIKDISTGEVADPRSFIIAISVLILKSILSILALAASFRLGRRAEISLTRRLAEIVFSPFSKNFYVSKPGDVIAVLESGSSTALNGFFLPAIGLVAEITTSVAVITIVSIVSPISAVVSIVTFVVSGMIIKSYSRNKIEQASLVNEAAFKESYSKLHSLILGHKIFRPLGRTSVVIDWFMLSRTKLARARGILDFFTSSPRYVTEFSLLVSVLGLLWIVSITQGIDRAFGAAALLFIAGSRIAPAVQRGFTNLNRIKTNLPIVSKITLWLSNEGLSSFGKNGENEITKFSHDKCSAIKLIDVSYSHNDNLELTLNNISAEFTFGKLNFILGESGSGKSTLCDVLIGLVSPTSGAVIFDSGRSIEGQFPEISYVPQEFMRFSGSIRENLSLSFDGLADDERLVNILHQVDLGGWISKLPAGLNTQLDSISANLSGGQSQRLSIARALYFDSPVIVMDEPTSALDSATAQSVMNVIRRCSLNKLVILVTHQTWLVKQGETVLKLKNGKVETDGTTDSEQG